MKRYYLTRLQIEGFRGINNDQQPLDLRFSVDKVNSIYAVNGLGKSSIYDALCYAIRGVIPKLADLQQSENADDYYCNLFHSQSRATIQLTIEADDDGSSTVIVVERDAAGTRTITSPTGHADPDSLLKSLDSDFTLLDQGTFESFIGSTPLDRGRAFSRMLGLSRLSQYRAAIAALAHKGNLDRDLGVPTLTAKQTSLTQQIQQAASRIRTSYDELTGAPYSGPIDSPKICGGVLASLKQISLLAPHCDCTSLAEFDFQAAIKTVSDAEKSKERERLVTLRVQLATLQKQVPPANKVDEIAAIRKAITERDEALKATKGSLVFENYRSALAVVSDEGWADPHQCPTCDTKQMIPLAESLNAKLAAYARASELAGKIKKLWQNSLTAVHLKEIESHASLNISAEAKRHTSLNTAFTVTVPTLNNVTEFADAVSSSEGVQAQTVMRWESEIKELEKKLPPSIVSVAQKLTAAQSLARDLADFEKLSPQLKVIDYQLKRRELWEAFIKLAQKTFDQAEGELVEKRQKAIAADYQQMHAAITRNPEVVPALDRSTTAERLHLKLDEFYGLKNVSANTLLQESYCNAVAISVFLSTALQCPSPARFIVLDDITSSFDSGHQFNLMELLRNRVSPPTNPDGPQVILLTHDTLLEKYLDKATTTGTWRHNKLLGTPPNGPVLTEKHNSGHVRQRAVDFLNAGQTDAAKPWVRQYLESVLSQIIRKVQIRVPLDYAMSDSRKQVQHSIDAIAETLELLQHAGRLILTVQQQQDATQTLVPALIGNWCAHYDTATYAGLTAHVLLGVIDDVDKLADCFKYDCKCQSPGTTSRRFYRDLSSKACVC